MALSRQQKIEKAQLLRVKGLTYQEIGDRLGVHFSTVYKWLNPSKTREYNKKDEARPGRKAEKKQWYDLNRAACPECGSDMGCGSTIPSRRPARCSTCHFFSLAERKEARDNKIEQWWAEGLTLVEIAARLDSTVNSIGTSINRLRAAGRPLPYRRAVYPAGKPRFPEQVAA
jgi:DNA-binding CsgD family transcriptional regulator